MTPIPVVNSLRSLILPFSPHEDKREQHDIYRVGDGWRDFETHVARFFEFEYTVSYATVGLGDCVVGVIFYELRNARDRI